MVQKFFPRAFHCSVVVSLSLVFNAQPTGTVISRRQCAGVEVFSWCPVQCDGVVVLFLGSFTGVW